MGGLEGQVTYGAGYGEGEEGSTASQPGDAGQGAASGVGDTAQDAVASAAETVQETASDVVGAAQGAASSAAETVQDTASTVVDTAQGAVSSATEAVQQTASAVVDTAQQATSAVTGAVSDKVDQVSDAAATRVERLADTVAQTVYSGDTPPGQRRVAETTVNALDRTAEYLREGDINLLVEDLRGVVRRHPLRSLLLGLGLGYLARGAFFPSTGAQGQSSGQPQPGGAPYMPPIGQVPVYSAAGYDASTGIGYDAAANTDIGVGTSGLDDTTVIVEGSDTLLADDLLSGDALGSADNAIDFPTGSALDVDAGLGVDSGALGAGTGATIGTDAGALASDEQFQAASDEAATPSPRDTMPSDDQLRNWDAGASGQSS